MVQRHQHPLFFLLPFRVRFPTHFLPSFFSQHTPLIVINLKYIQWITQTENESSESPFNQAVIFPSGNSPQKYLVANLTTIYLDSKTTIFLKNHQSQSNNLHASHTTQSGQVIRNSQDG